MKYSYSTGNETTDMTPQRPYVKQSI